MRKTLCLHLLALLAISWWNFTDAKALEESNDEILSLEDAYEDLQEKELLTKRDPDNQEDEEVLEEREERQEEAEEEKEEKTEKRMDVDSEASEVEELETRGVQAKFTLVDYKGRKINSLTEREGLLLFKGGTVCGNQFSMNSAHAVCNTMGFSKATHWRQGLVYGTFQSSKKIGLDKVKCSSNHWASCTSTTTHTCKHDKDVMLTCVGTGFQLLNRAGKVVRRRKEGLLTYQHGTVCDDYFNIDAAHAICRVMGFSHAVRWGHGLKYGLEQTTRRITMDDIMCEDSYWNYCTFSNKVSCQHNEDVFLTCQPGHPQKPGFRLVDWQGRPAPRTECEALLLYNGGTVCQDHFSMNSAHAICKTMGFKSASKFRSGLAYGAGQKRRRIKLSEVRCMSTEWNKCTYSRKHDCKHGDDILLTCRP